MGFEILVDDSCLMDPLKQTKRFQGKIGDLTQRILVMLVKIVR